MNLLSDIIDFCSDKIDDEHLRYLHARGISDDSIKKYSICTFQPLSDLFRIFNPVLLREAGVVFDAKHSRFITHPLIFPIKDLNGNVIAICGRTLMSDDERNALSLQKYIHTEYKKSRHLFNLNNAIPFIRKNDLAIVVEGQFDTITAVQNGVTNVVGVGSSSLSVSHALLLSRYCSRLVIIPDNDSAGESCVSKASKFNKWSHGIKMYYCNIPSQHHDLDDFFRSGKTKQDLVSIMKNGIKRI